MLYQVKCLLWKWACWTQIQKPRELNQSSPARVQTLALALTANSHVLSSTFMSAPSLNLNLFKISTRIDEIFRSFNTRTRADDGRMGVEENYRWNSDPWTLVDLIRPDSNIFFGLIWHKKTIDLIHSALVLSHLFLGSIRRARHMTNSHDQNIDYLIKLIAISSLHAVSTENLVALQGMPL